MIIHILLSSKFNQQLLVQLLTRNTHTHTHISLVLTTLLNLMKLMDIEVTRRCVFPRMSHRVKYKGQKESQEERECERERESQSQFRHIKMIVQEEEFDLAFVLTWLLNSKERPIFSPFVQTSNHKTVTTFINSTSNYCTLKQPTSINID